MSSDFNLARKKLATISSSVKQDKVQAAAQALLDAVLLIFRNPMMKAEKEEFQNQVEHAVYQLSGNNLLRQHYPLQLKYDRGQEKALVATLKDIIKHFQDMLNEEVQDHLALLEKQKKEAFEKGRALIDSDQLDEAKEIFDQLISMASDDTKLKSDIADEFMRNPNGYKYAFDYLDEALKNDPNALFLYNRIGIVLRKMQDFETAEKYYSKALELTENDEYLFFNAGRLYLDWGKWEKVEECAVKAIEINPDFEQAGKMLKFARKKMK